MAKDGAGHGSEKRSSAYLAAKSTKRVLDDKVSAASAALQKFPKGQMGMTPEHVRTSPAFKQARASYEKASANAGAHNKGFLKQHGKEYAAERSERTRAVSAGKELLGRKIDLTSIKGATAKDVARMAGKVGKKT